MIALQSVCANAALDLRSRAIFHGNNRLLDRSGQIESNYDEVTDSFDAMNLKPELLRGMLHI